MNLQVNGRSTLADAALIANVSQMATVAPSFPRDGMTTYKITAGLLAGVLLALNGGLAEAHSPYLRPNVFDATGRDHVTVEASFTEDIFEAEVVMRSDFFHIVGPNGDTPI